MRVYVSCIKQNGLFEYNCLHFRCIFLQARLFFELNTGNENQTRVAELLVTLKNKKGFALRNPENTSSHRSGGKRKQSKSAPLT